MFSAIPLTYEEQQIARRLDRYFKSSTMTPREKVFNAILIAQHELEAQHFSSEVERIRISHFKSVLDGLLGKLTDQ